MYAEDEEEWEVEDKEMKREKSNVILIPDHKLFYKVNDHF
jgi:hypothetical protein